ncbi:hypothetical protein [Paenibacillus sp. Soil787]|uniref:hypothetical protein n=1 Tax=Paenibacillus sp. Soil787 TaxID=1736411 RepID=UPI0006F236C3|nr:hypothetical protein [Paenibacillus sp. Soil787]KRF39845.1 hypothetical protein ASG93_23070 [Paenibacillus sp. Soil787]
MKWEQWGKGNRSPILKDEERFRQHKFYKSVELINIGAFPFLPDSTSLMEKFSDEIIMDSPEKAYERTTRPRGSKEYYGNRVREWKVVPRSAIAAIPSSRGATDEPLDRENLDLDSRVLGIGLE